MVGAAYVYWAVRGAVSADPDATRLLLLGLLMAAALICSRLPLRIGHLDVTIMLDSVPLVLVVLLLPVHDAVLVGLATGLMGLVGQPRAPGWAGRWFLVVEPLSVAASMGVAGMFASWILDGHTEYVLIAIIPAFLISLVLELCFDVTIIALLESFHPGSYRHFFEAPAPTAANIALPALAAVVLTPYLDRPWLFALLLPILLVSMYGALWIANSQQLEKRRGERLKDTFGRYVPEGIVDDNLETMQQVELGGEQHEVTVLFCDIRGFTAWSEDKGATEVITELNVLLSELSASVMDNQGTLDKFTGDGLMAFWGAPVPTDEHASRACRAALDMLDRLEGVNRRRAEEGQAPFAIGIGVHSGTAVVGNVGHERRLDYTVIGDTVNTTARLEASTKEMGAVLLVSSATIELLDEPLHNRAARLGDVTVKGKQRPIEVWSLARQGDIIVTDADDALAA